MSLFFIKYENVSVVFDPISFSYYGKYFFIFFSYNRFLTNRFQLRISIYLLTIKIYNFFNKIFTIFETILLDSWRNRLQGNLRRPLVGRSVADTVSNLTERPIFSRKSFVFVPHGGPHPQISRLFLCVVGFSRGGHLRVLTYDQSFHV